MRCLAFAHANAGSNAGAVHVNSNNGFSNANSNYGARLTDTECCRSACGGNSLSLGDNKPKNRCGTGTCARWVAA